MDFGQVTQASATDRHISSDKSDFNVHLICTDQRCTANILAETLCLQVCTTKASIFAYFKCIVS